MSTTSTVKLYNVSFTETGADCLPSAPTPPTSALTFSTLTPVKLSDKFFKIDITNFNYNDIYTKNYVQIVNPDGTYYAFIKGVEWLSYNAVRVDFSVDLWHTYINKCTIKSGFLERSNDKSITITNRGDISPAAYTTYTNGQRIYTSDNAFILYMSPFGITNGYKYYRSPSPSSGVAVFVDSIGAFDHALKAISYDLTRVVSCVAVPRSLFGYNIENNCKEVLWTPTDSLLYEIEQGTSPITSTYTVSLPFTNDEFFGCGSSPCMKVRLRVGGQSQDYAIENLDITDGKITYYVSLALNSPCPSFSVKMKTKTVANAGDITKILPPLTISDFPTVPVAASALDEWQARKLVSALFSVGSSIVTNPVPTSLNGVLSMTLGNPLNIAGQAINAIYDSPSSTSGSVDTLFSVNDFGIYIDIVVPSVSERTRIVNLYNYVGFPFNKPVTSLNIFPSDGENYRQTTLKNAVISGSIPDEAKEFIASRLSGGVRVWSSL